MPSDSCTFLLCIPTMWFYSIYDKSSICLGYLCKEYGRHSILLHKILMIVSIYLHSMSTLALEKTDYNYGVCTEELDSRTI